MSLRASSGLPEACSGDMYATVPITKPGRVWSRRSTACVTASRLEAFTSFASPKSASFA